MEFDVSRVRQLLSDPGKVIIVTHVSPDGDAIGSSLAMYHYLNDQNVDVQVITPDEDPSFLHWMPGHDKILPYDKNEKECEELLENADLIFCLDFNTVDRMSGLSAPVAAAKATKILIDHHQYPEQWTEVMISEPSASSTAELVYQFIDQLGGTIDKKIAECLYVGIVTDTGSFKFPSTSSLTMEIGAKLLSLGVEGSRIQNLVYDNSSEHRLRLLGYALTQKLEILHDLNTAIISLDSDELEKFHYQKGDTEGIVNYPLSIDHIRLAIFISKKNGEVRLSFRSKGDVPAHDIARNHFSGGGHKNAAGGISELDVEGTVQKLKSLLPDYKEHLQ